MTHAGLLTFWMLAACVSCGFISVSSFDPALNAQTQDDLSNLRVKNLSPSEVEITVD